MLGLLLLLSVAWWVYDAGGPIELCLCGATISPGKKIVSLLDGLPSSLPLSRAELWWVEFRGLSE